MNKDYIHNKVLSIKRIGTMNKMASVRLSNLVEEIINDAYEKGYDQCIIDHENKKGKATAGRSS